MGPELLLISITLLMSTASVQLRPPNYSFKETMNKMLNNELIQQARTPEDQTNKKRMYFILYKKVQGTRYRSVGTLHQKKKLHEGLLNCSHPLKIGIHGWQQPTHSKFSTAMVGAYLDSMENVQVLMVRWLAADLSYVRARLAVPIAAEQVYKYLNRIKDEVPCFDFESITLIGHSMGAQVAGVAGNLARGIINTIVALDPANPLFWENSSDVVNVLSAQRVIGVHTCPGYYGVEFNVGRVDFWPNMGVTPQPGCVVGGKGPTSTAREAGAEEFSITDAVKQLACSHEKSIYYFFETVRNRKVYTTEKCECTHYGCKRIKDHPLHHFNEITRASGQYCFNAG